MSDHVFVPSLLMFDARLVTPDWTLFISVPSLACSLTLDVNSVALSAAVFENLKTELLATSAHFTALLLKFDIDVANIS